MKSENSSAANRCSPPRAMVSVLFVLVELLVVMVIAVPNMASAETRTFREPRIFRERLDLCARWGIQCGQPAARQYCRSFRGMNDAIDWRVDHDIGLQSPTRTILDGQRCAAGFCDGFKEVTCQSLHRVSGHQAGCSSTAIFTDRAYGDVLQIVGGIGVRVRADRVAEGRNIRLLRNDRRIYQIRLASASRTIRFFCLRNGTWERERVTCARPSQIAVISRINGGGRKIRVNCYNE